MAVAMAAMAALSVAQGVSGKMQGDANAANAEYIGSVNAANAKAAGDVNAKNAITLSEYNASKVLDTADINSDVVLSVAEYNSSIQTLTADYNSLLFDQEISLIWEDLELDIFQYSNEARLALGTSQAKFAASGVLLGRENESLDMALVDMKTQTDLDILIKRNNADTAARRMQDEQAKSNFNGQVASDQIKFTGDVDSFNILSAAETQAKSITMQGSIDSANAKWSGDTGAATATYDAALDAHASTEKGNAALVDGMMKAGASAYSAYDSAPPKVSSSSTTTAIASNSGSSGATSATILQIGNTA